MLCVSPWQQLLTGVSLRLQHHHGDSPPTNMTQKMQAGVASHGCTLLRGIGGSQSVVAAAVYVCVRVSAGTAETHWCRKHGRLVIDMAWPWRLSHIQKVWSTVWPISSFLPDDRKQASQSLITDGRLLTPPLTRWCSLTVVGFTVTQLRCSGTTHLWVKRKLRPQQTTQSRRRHRRCRCHLAHISDSTAALPGSFFCHF